MNKLALAALGLAFTACTEAAEPTPDGGAPIDLGVLPTDSSVRDAGLADAADADADLPDAAPSDLGWPDSGVPPWGPVVVDIGLSRPPALLSDYRLLRLEGGTIRYNDGVVPYELATPLYSDYALKDRALWVPAGQQIGYQALDAFDFPVGSVIAKTFSFAPDLRQPEVDRRFVETRLLVKYADGWHALPYRWRADGSDADYFVRGDVELISFIDPLGAPRTANYLIPQKNQCNACHDLNDDNGAAYTTVIGPKARHLNRRRDYDGVELNQLQHLADLGMLSGLPKTSTVPADTDFGSITSTLGWSFSSLEKAARDYLDVNCAHCHNPRGVQGVTSRLYLNIDNQDEFTLGFCKEPGSAGSGAGGLRYDIVPGAPSESILSYRIESERVGEMMPLLGRSLADTMGTRVVRAWIQALPPRACD